ncbi:unnamed protein product, partial [marine sediment metagenome]
MKMARVWAMPTSDTFDCPPIGTLVKRFLGQSKVSIDPFARNKRWATYTNDLNPKTAAEYHMDVYAFLQMLLEKGIISDLLIFDPPYSPRQVKECYDSVGLKMGLEGGQRTHGWTKEKDTGNELLEVGGHVLSFGWNSQGMGKGRGFVTEEILL